MSKKKLEEKFRAQMNITPRPREPMMPRPTVFSSHKDYDRNKEKKAVRQLIEEEEGFDEP